jgi:hypothetical protein
MRKDSKERGEKKRNRNDEEASDIARLKTTHLEKRHSIVKHMRPR